MALSIRQPPSSAINIVKKLVENKPLEEGEKYEILPIKPEGRGAESPQPHSTPKGKAEPVASVLTKTNETTWNTGASESPANSSN